MLRIGFLEKKEEKKWLKIIYKDISHSYVKSTDPVSQYGMWCEMVQILRSAVECTGWLEVQQQQAAPPECLICSCLLHCVCQLSCWEGGRVRANSSAWQL